MASPVPPTAALPPRTRRTIGQSTATASVPLESDSERTLVIPGEQTGSSEGQEVLRDSSGRRTRTSSRPGSMVAEHGATLLDCALVRGSRRASGRNRSSVSPLTIQEATPDDSAAEKIQPLATDVEMADDESADRQLITESTKAATSPNSVTTSTPDDVDAIQASTSDSDDSDNQGLSVPRRHTSGADAQTSRLRRSRGRPSYVELAPSNSSDEELEEDDYEGWDPEGDEESVVDDDEFEVDVQSSADEDADENDDDSVDVEPEPTSVSRRRPQLPPKQGKGLDLNLPPLDNIRDITADMTSKALELGLSEVLGGLKERSINIATMCSGTESPLLFLQMLAEALDARGETPLRVKHHFSAEIDATKQAYIERNFHPPILFRDVRQLGDEDATTATTAYGAEEESPGDLDVLVAGFVCKDLSSLNSRKRTVDDQGETGDTWRAIYYYVKRFQPSIILLENVKSDKRMWDDVVSRWSTIG